MTANNPFSDPNFGAEASGTNNPFSNPEFGKPSGFTRRVADQGIKLAQGVVGVPEAAVGVADLVTGGQAGKLAEQAGVRFKDAKDILGEYLSPEQKAADAEVQKADGFLPTLGAMVRNPSTIIGSAVESAPSMLVGGAASRGLLAVAPKIGAIAAGAMGEGLTAAGQNAEQVRQEDPNGTLTPQQSAILAASGALTGGISLASGKLANKLGIGDVQTMLAAGKLGTVGEEAAQTAATKGFTRKLAEGFANEGVLQELPQSYQEQVAQNLAQDKPWDEGAAKAGAQGMMAGALMGGGANAASHFAEGSAPAPAAPEATAATTSLQLGNTPDPYLSFPDGTVARRSEVDSYINALPEDQQPAARAKIMGLSPQPVVQDAPAAETGIPATEIPVAPVKPSEVMGLDPAAGPMSAAAVIAVDTGAHQPQAPRDSTAAVEPDPAVSQLATMPEATHKAAMTPYSLFGDSGHQEGDVLGESGKPFSTRESAMAMLNKHPGGEIAEFGNGFVIRRPKAGANASHETEAGLSEVQANQAQQAETQRQEAPASEGVAPITNAGEPLQSANQKTAAPITQPAQPGVTGEGPGVSQSGTGAVETSQPAFEKAVGEPVAPVPQKADSATSPAKPANAIRAARIKSTLESGGRIVDGELRTNNGMGLMKLTPDELITVPSDRVTTSQSANGAGDAVVVAPVNPVQDAQATAGPKKPNALQQKREQYLKDRADYFTPGNIVENYGGHDEVLSYTSPKSDGSGWSVKVRSVVNQDGKWIADPKDGRERIHSTQPDAKKLASGPTQRVQVAPAAVADKDGGHIGRDNKPLSEGGKPFKTRLAAGIARKLQPMMRVVTVKGGYVLAEKTEKQLAAEAKASLRLSNPQTSPPGEPIPAHAFIAAEGGLHLSARNDMNVGGNPVIGNRRLFAGLGKGLSIEKATARIIEEGYLSEGASHSDAMATIKKSLISPQHNADGIERMAEMEDRARYDAYELDQQNSVDEVQSLDDNEFRLTDDEIPFDSALSNASTESAMRAMGFTEQEIQNAITNESRVTQADSRGRGGFDETQASRPQEGDGRRATAPPAGAAEEGLTAPTRADVLAAGVRKDNAAALDAQQQAIIENQNTPLTQQRAPEQRTDTSGDMFDVEKAQAVIDKRNAGVEKAKDPNQAGMFDEPAQEDADELSQPIDQLRKIARDDDHPDSQEARSELARHGLGYGHGNSDHLIIGSMKPPSEEWMQVQNFRQRGVYELAASDLKRFLKLAKARSLDAFEGQAISDRDSTISKWLAESKPTEPANQATAILDAANITGKERIEALKDVKNGDITPDELKAAYPAKIEDSGEVLEGARKLYAKNYAAKLAEGEGMDTAAVPLSKSWPEPDYQRLIDEGADLWAVSMARAMRDEIPTKPSSWKLKGWVKAVESLRDFASGAMSGKYQREEIINSATGFHLKDWINKVDLYQAVGHAKSLKTLKFSMGEYGMYGGQTFSPAKKMWTINQPGTSNASTWSHGNWGNDLVVADTKAEAIEKFKTWSAAQVEAPPAAAKATSFDIYSYRSKPGITIVGKRINSTKSIDLKEFATVKDAREYKAANQTELERLLAAAKFEPSERGESNAPRVGADHRNGADVTSAQFRETFGFRGEQFGASMPQNERQANMNQAYDALMDLAGVVGIPPKALSLNGELGLAFGARGTGGKNPAAAHYERDTTGAVTPNRVVINLTRKNGAGSLAHEWFHAVDNYFARMRGEKAGMLTESHASRGEGVRPEMVAAFKQLMMAIQSSGVRERSKQLDKKRVKDYWSTGLEMAARSFESYVIAKLQDNNGSNDYLANIVPESLYTMQGSYPYPIMGEMPAIRAAFDNFFGAIQTKETEQGMAMFSRSGSGKSDVLSKDGKFKGWPKFNTWTRQEYSDVVSLLPAAYREDAHRREPVAAKDWDALAAAVLPELEAINNAAGEGAFRLDPLGNIVGDVRRHDSSVFASELVAIANRHDLGIFLTGLRTSSMAPLTEMGFVPEMGLGAILARSTGSTAPVIPMASGTVNNTAYGTMMSYLPRGFAAPMFSKAEGGASQQPTRGTPVPRVQAVVDAITANWANAPEVVVVSDMQDEKVPQKVREADQLQKSQGAEGEPDGFIYKGTVYLVASELPTINDAVRVLFHEALGHSGLRGAFGDALKPILSQVAAMRRADIVKKAREYGLLNLDTPRGATVNEQWQAMTEKNRQVAAEEVLAVMAQTKPELGFVKRAVAAIRNWLRTNVPGFKSLSMTDADIIQAFIFPARRQIEGRQSSSPVKNTSLEAIAQRELNLLDLIACLG